MALSSCESEYVALTTCVQEVNFVLNLFNELEISLSGIIIKTDSRSAMALVDNPIVSQRSKHIDIKFHYIREFLKQREANLMYVKTDLNQADIFTKDLHGNKFKTLVGLVYGVRN